jgi:hypothetical protein
MEKKLNCENITKKTKKITRDKCIPLGIKDDNVPPKFVVQIENATLKDHNLYKSGLKNIKLYQLWNIWKQRRFIIMI